MFKFIIRAKKSDHSIQKIVDSSSTSLLVWHLQQCMSSDSAEVTRSLNIVAQELIMQNIHIEPIKILLRDPRVELNHFNIKWIFDNNHVDLIKELLQFKRLNLNDFGVHGSLLELEDIIDIFTKVTKSNCIHVRIVNVAESKYYIFLDQKYNSE